MRRDVTLFVAPPFTAEHDRDETTRILCQQRVRSITNRRRFRRQSLSRTN